MPTNLLRTETGKECIGAKGGLTMPGYILHLTAAKMALNYIKYPIDTNAFFIGNLLPDTVRDKRESHFRNWRYRDRMIEHPDLEMFLRKYKSLLSDSSCLGYYFHLYIDYKFFTEYVPEIVTLLDENEQAVTKKDQVVWVKINKTGKLIPRGKFYSDEYYYGDYTRMNTYLVEEYQLLLELGTDIKNPGIEEVDYADVKNVLDELHGYLDVPASAVEELKVFEVESLMKFLGKVTKEFCDIHSFEI